MTYHPISSIINISIDMIDIHRKMNFYISQCTVRKEKSFRFNWITLIFEVFLCALFAYVLFRIDFWSFFFRMSALKYVNLSVLCHVYILFAFNLYLETLTLTLSTSQRASQLADFLNL